MDHSKALGLRISKSITAVLIYTILIYNADFSSRFPLLDLRSEPSDPAF